MWTMAKIKKMSKEELQKRIDQADGVRTVYAGASRAELVNKFVHYVNAGKIQ